MILQLERRASDADADCRSVSGYGYSLDRWSSRKQRLVADPICFAEYIVLHESCHEAIFLRQLLDSVDFPCRGSTPIYCDNDAASRLAEDHVLHSQVKYIRVEFHAIRDSIDLGGVQVFRVRSADNTADILTKPLGRSDFLRLVLCMTTTLGGTCIYFIPANTQLTVH